MNQKDHIIDQKGLKRYEKKQKIEFLDLKYLLFSGIFLSGIGGYPTPPLAEIHPAQNPLAERGLPPPPLTEKIHCVDFESIPYFDEVVYC